MVAIALMLAIGTAASAEPELERLEGRWKLDWDHSESFEPVMKALEVPWLLRRLAGVASAHVTLQLQPSDCGDCPSKLLIVEESPVSTTDFVATLDGVSRPGVDPAGNETMDAYRLSGEAGVELLRTRLLSSGRSARIRELRTPGTTSDTLDSVLTVWVDDEQQAKVRRLFRRAGD